MFEKNAQTTVPIHDLIAKRWSGRAYDPDRLVSREHLFALCEAARWAPSCYGDEPWRFLIWDRKQQADDWRVAFECLAEGNKAWAAAAPVLMLVAADNRFTHNDAENRWAQYDAGAAAMTLCLQATAMGMMVHQMGGFDAARLSSAFAIPDTVTCMAMLTVGYQLPESRIPPELSARERAARARQPLDSRFFSGQWSNPLKTD
jgi:nitroreductase